MLLCPHPHALLEPELKASRKGDRNYLCLTVRCGACMNRYEIASTERSIEGHELLIALTPGVLVMAGSPKWQ